MNLIYSPTVGILVSSAGTPGVPEVHLLAGQERWSEAETLYVLPNIRDWQIVESNVSELAPLIQRCTMDYWISRSQSLIICLIDGVSDSLTIEVMEHIESIIQSHCSADDVLSRLLVAPLKDPTSVERLLERALAEGFGSTAGILDRLFGLQPLLRRLAAAWLNLPAECFIDLPVSREAFWQDLATRSLLTRLIEAADKAAFTNAWTTLIFDNMDVPGRRAIVHLGNLLADALHPTSIRRTRETGRADDSDRVEDELGEHPRYRDVSGHTAYERAIKQVKGIRKALVQGRDAKASRFLRELIEEQSRHSSREQLTKSLCNIARECALMFRPDFERRCLDQALKVAPNDAWTLIQMGNHLKQVGQYDEAIEMLQKAVNSQHARVALASIADAWCEMGNYDKATEVYQGIPAWEGIVEIRTGLADIMRHTGEFAPALSEYERILIEWPDADRAAAGKADILRRSGHVSEAITLYDSLIYSPAVDDFGRIIYRLAKCALLKQTNQLEDAFNLADSVLRNAPYCMLARVHRASILALLGKEAKGLASLPRTDAPRAIGAWIQQYCRGLLLLKLNRYEKARQLLVERFRSSVLEHDNQVVVRLGAAFALLWRNDIGTASSVLSEVRDVRDYYTEYVYHVLELHLSVLKNDNVRIEEIVRRLESAQERDAVLAKAVRALRSNNLAAAKGYELELLLRIAA